MLTTPNRSNRIRNDYDSDRIWTERRAPEIVCIVVLYSKTLTIFIIDVAMFYRMHRYDLRVVEATRRDIDDGGESHSVGETFRCSSGAAEELEYASEQGSPPFSLVCVRQRRAAPTARSLAESKNLQRS